MIEEPERGERGPSAQKLNEPENCLKSLKRAYSLSPLQETHSKATAVGGDVKMKDNVKTLKTKVKHEENMRKETVDMREKMNEAERLKWPCM